MKKQFQHIALANLAIVIIIALCMIAGEGTGDFFLSMGIILLLLGIINIIVGLIVSIIAMGYVRFKWYGAAMLLFAGISLLCSFTFCTIQPFRL